MEFDWNMIINIISTAVLAIIAYRSMVSDTGIFRMKQRESEDKDLILNAEQTKSISLLEKRLESIEDELDDHEKLNANSFENMYKDFNVMIQEYKKFFDGKAEKIASHDQQLKELDDKVKKLQLLREKDIEVISEMKSDISSIKTTLNNLDNGFNEIRQFIFNQSKK